MSILAYGALATKLAPAALCCVGRQWRRTEVSHAESADHLPLTNPSAFSAPSQMRRCDYRMFTDAAGRKIAEAGFAAASWNRTWRSGRQSAELFDS